MGRNRLKDIFSTNPPLPEIKLLFQNAEAETQFEKAMYLAWDEGHPVNVEGVNGIIAYDSSTSRKMPFLFEDNLEGFMVGPSSETRAFDITTPKGRKNVSLGCFTSPKKTTLRTSKDSIIFQEFTFSSAGERTYNAKIQKERAQSVSQLADSYCIAIGLLEHFMPDKDVESSADAEHLQGIKKALRFTYRFYMQLCALEKVLQRVIKPTDIEASIDEMAKVNELYLLLVQKIPLHFDGQINVTENNSVNLISNPGATLEVGKEILITFYREQDVSFCGISVHLYFVNILKHAIIKKIIDEGEQTRLIYGETDSNPMQLFFTAFLSEQEAAEEHANAKDKEAEYTKARTAADYFHMIADSFNP